MAIERTNRPRNGLAAVYMLAAVTSLSLIPLIVARSGGVENPFLFNAGWRAGVVIGCLGFVFVFYFAQITNRVFWQLIKRRIFDLAILLSIIGNFEYALFTWSTRYLDISVVAILYAVWPIFVILLVARLFDEESRFRRISRSTILLLFVGLAGYALVVTSQVGGIFEVDVLVAVPILGVLPGIILAITAAVATSLAGFSFKWGSEVSREMAAKSNGNASNEPDDLFFLVVAIWWQMLSRLD